MTLPKHLAAGWQRLFFLSIFSCTPATPDSANLEDHAHATGTELTETHYLLRQPASFVEDLRIGAVDDGPYSLASVWDIAVDDQGRIYALLRQEGTIRTFDSTGTFLFDIGRKGEGPGEFSNPHKLAFDQSGNLWVTDINLARYSVFDSTTFLTSHTRTMSGDCPVWSAGWFANDGRLIDGGIHLETFPSGLVCQLSLLNDQFEAAQVLVMPSSGQRGPYPVRAPFAFDPQGAIWVGLNHTYQLFKLAFGGDTLAVAQREVEPVAVQPDDIARMKEAQETFQQAMRGPVEARSVTEAPRTKPAFAHLAVDDASRLWVAPSGAIDGKADALDVFEPTGQWIARIPLSTPVNVASVAGPGMERYPLLIRDHTLYAIVESELGVPFVVRMRLQSVQEPPS